ncbi:hypothetical protein LCGC14_2306800, partial [marine sediment metagenome]
VQIAPKGRKRLAGGVSPREERNYMKIPEGAKEDAPGGPKCAAPLSPLRGYASKPNCSGGLRPRLMLLCEVPMSIGTKHE